MVVEAYLPDPAFQRAAEIRQLRAESAIRGKVVRFPTGSLLAHDRVMVRIVAGAALTATVPGFGKVVSREV
jgi:hypothetical protein